MTQQDGPDDDGGALRYEDDPWYDAVASGLPGSAAERSGAGGGAGRRNAPPGGAVPWNAQPLPPSRPHPSAERGLPADLGPQDAGPEGPQGSPGARDARDDRGVVRGARDERPRDDELAAVYFAVHRSAKFQEVRRRHRRFVFPAAVAFLLWYLAYIVTATTAPGLMATPVGGGPVNVGLLAGLGQFLSTALLVGAYAWHAHFRRDRTALDLRWETQQRTREAVR
ncbi:DUF485 domain-containing protein [Streptomyces sp. WMMC1477]|uniref:DUF485 domain-containing protein n=1 Tax=Streptomyces sp. WMMC1477 TaxID=3015155 RepID=UPI003FCDC43E